MAAGGLPHDPVALDEAEKQFWKGLWDTAVEDAVVDLGIDMVRFGPVVAAVVSEEPAELALNFILGAAAPGAMEDGYLPAAVRWIERHDVEYRVPLSPALPEALAAEGWLREHRYRLLKGPAKLLRDGSPPDLRPPPGIDVSGPPRSLRKTKALATRWRRASASPTGRRLLPSTYRSRKLALLLRGQRRRAARLRRGADPRASRRARARLVPGWRA